eukprot:gene9946-10807_t
MVTLAVGSTNPVKVNAARHGAIAALKVEDVLAEGFNVPSGVADQPYGDEETQRGATQRAINAFHEYEKKHGKSPDYSLGLEGGVKFTSSTEEELECFAWMIVYNGKEFGKARTGSFLLPKVIRDLMVKEGLELGVADDRVFSTINSKQGGGSVGQFTRGVIDRTSYYEHAIVLAFIPFIWQDLYFGENQSP